MRPTALLQIVPWGAASILVALMVGCSSTSYEVKVDAVAKHDERIGGSTEAQSYKIKSKNPAMGEENLRYLEAVDYVKTALSGKGMYEAPSDELADMIVELDYGVEAPRTRIQTVSVPRYGQVGGGVRYEQLPVTDTRGNVIFRTVAVYERPRTELLGFEERPQRVTVYEKYLRITARENKSGVEGRPPAELWRVQTSTEDESKDLRKYLPIMASATADHIGKDSGNPKIIKVKDESPAVDFIRKGMSSPPASVSRASVERPKI